MEQDQTKHRNADDKGNVMSSPSIPPEILSTPEEIISETAIEPHDDLDRDLPGREETEGDSTSAPLPQAITHSENTSGSNHVEKEDEHGGVMPEQQRAHPNIVVVAEDVATTQDWDPLRIPAKDSYAEKESGEQASVREMDGAVYCARQDQLTADEKSKDMQSPTAAASRRGSQLHLDLKTTLPSTQPWNGDALLNPVTRPKLDYPESGSATQSKFPKHSRLLKPKSSYYFGPPPEDSAFGTPPLGQIGVHYPREMVRIERDYSGGELPQFAAIYPLEFEGRISPTQFLESINSINEILISAHSLRHALVDNALAIFSLQLSKLILRTHYEKEMERVHEKIRELNESLFNPVGLNILWPRKVAFLFLEIEYY